jgi:RNA recognition motif-containing protein
MTGNRQRCFADAKYHTMNNTKLHVGNLAFETAEIQIEDLFAEVGTVVEASLMQDPGTGRSRGFAFVTMANAADAQEAIRRFNGAELNGRPLTVTEARPKEERARGPVRNNRR